jgi:hypothetical protein
MVLAVASVLSLAATAAAQPVLGGFQGSWTTVDCSDGGGGVDPDCSVWGDGSGLTMQIGFGRNPKVTIKDTYATACADGGAATTKWSGSGTGWYTQDVSPDGAPGPIYLHVVLGKAGCGTFSTTGDLGRDMPSDIVELVFYHDLGSDTIWFDPDGIDGGLDWYRTN